MTEREQAESPLKIGQLVVDPDGYYAIVWDQPGSSTGIPEGQVELFLSNGTRTFCVADKVGVLGLKHGGKTVPPAHFAEILNSKFQ